MAKQEIPVRGATPVFSNPQAERAIVAAILANPSKTWKDVLTTGLRAEWFTDRLANAAFTAIGTLMAEGQPIDPILVAECIKKTNTTKGLAEEFTNSYESWPKGAKTHEGLKTHIALVSDKFQRQSAVYYMQDAQDRLSSGEDVVTVLGTLKNVLSGVSREGGVTDRPYSDVVADIMSGFEIAGATGEFGIAVPWRQLSMLIAGLPKGKMTIVGGRPKQGKSTLVKELARFTACERKEPVGVWSMEMTKEEWLQNTAGAAKGIDCFKMKSGRYSPGEFEQFKEGLDELGKAPLYINDRPQTIGSLCSDIREQIAEKHLSLVIIDYLTMIKSETRSGRAESRQQEVAGWSNSLTNLAKDCPYTAFVVVSQLKRPGQQDTVKPPELHDLRESGAIEQDAYMVIFVYQDPFAGDAVIPDNAPTIIEVAANRGGRSGKFTVTFEKSKQRFAE